MVRGTFFRNADSIAPGSGRRCPKAWHPLGPSLIFAPIPCFPWSIHFVFFFIFLLFCGYTVSGKPRNKVKRKKGMNKRRSTENTECTERKSERDHRKRGQK